MRVNIQQLVAILLEKETYLVIKI